MSRANRPSPGTAGVLVLACVAVGALVFDPSAPAAQPKTVVLLATAVLLSSLAATRILTPSLTAPLAAFAGLVVWSTVRGHVAAAGAPLALMAISAVVAGLPRRDRVWLARTACVVTGSAAAVCTTLTWLAGARGMQLHGGMGNPDWLGLLLAVTLVPTLLWTREAFIARERIAWPLAAGVAFQLAAWLLSASRTAWVALPVGLLVALVPRRRVGVALVTGLAAASLALALAPDMTARSPWLHALAGRIWIFKGSLAAAVDALPFGLGAGRFADGFLVAQGRMLSGMDAGEAARHFVHATTAHNEWLHALAELGLPGAFLLIATVALGIDGVAKRWPAGAGAGAALAVGATGDVPLHVPALLAMVTLIWSSAPRWTIKLPERVAGPRFAALGLLILCAVSLDRSVRDFRATRWLTQARSALPGPRTALLARAVRFAPDLASARFQCGIDQLDRGSPASALVSLGRAQQLSDDVATDVAIGNALVRLHHDAAARDAFERALAKDPGAFKAHANLAVVLGRLTQFARADRELSLAARLWPGNPKLPLIREALFRARLEHETAARGR